jgi:zinc transporter 1/2/3
VSTSEDNHDHSHGHSHDGDQPHSGGSTDTNANVHHHHHHHHHHSADLEGGDAGNSAVSAYVLMVALSLHAVFEGIALGLQDSVDRVFTLGLGLLTHKWVEACSNIFSSSPFSSSFFT